MTSQQFKCDDTKNNLNKFADKNFVLFSLCSLTFNAIFNKIEIQLTSFLLIFVDLLTEMTKKKYETHVYEFTFLLLLFMN